MVVARYSVTRGVYRCLEDAPKTRGWSKVGEDTDRGVRKSAQEEANKIRSRHPLRFRTERTSRGAFMFTRKVPA